MCLFKLFKYSIFKTESSIYFLVILPIGSNWHIEKKKFKNSNHFKNGSHYKIIFKNPKTIQGKREFMQYYEIIFKISKFIHHVIYRYFKYLNNNFI